MLKKLFRYEWKACWKLMAVLNAIVIVLSVIGLFVFRNDFWYSSGRDDIGQVVSGAVMSAYFITYFMSVASLGFVVNLYFYIRFYRNLYTDQGYLMHTLPVKPWELIWSKAFVGLIWQFISTFVLIFSVFGVIFNTVAKATDESIWDMFSKMFSELFENVSGGWIFTIGLLYLLLAIAGACMSMFLGYTAISIGQTFKKHKVVGAIGVYFGLYSVLQFVAAFFTVPVARWIDVLTRQDNMHEPNVAAVLGILLVAIVLLTTGMYFLNEHIMKYKLNLE